MKPLSTLKKKGMITIVKQKKSYYNKGDVASEIVGLIEYTARGFISLAWLGKCSSGNKD